MDTTNSLTLDSDIYASPVLRTHCVTCYPLRVPASSGWDGTVCPGCGMPAVVAATELIESFWFDDHEGGPVGPFPTAAAAESAMCATMTAGEVLQ